MIFAKMIRKIKTVTSGKITDQIAPSEDPEYFSQRSRRANSKSNGSWLESDMGLFLVGCILSQHKEFDNCLLHGCNKMCYIKILRPGNAGIPVCFWIC